MLPELTAREEERAQRAKMLQQKNQKSEEEERVQQRMCPRAQTQTSTGSVSQDGDVQMQDSPQSWQPNMTPTQQDFGQQQQQQSLAQRGTSGMIIGSNRGNNPGAQALPTFQRVTGDEQVPGRPYDTDVPLDGGQETYGLLRLEQVLVPSPNEKLGKRRRGGDEEREDERDKRQLS
jgi:hypothetical protein